MQLLPRFGRKNTAAAMPINDVSVEKIFFGGVGLGLRWQSVECPGIVGRYITRDTDRNGP